MLPTPDPTFSLLLATLRWPDDDNRRSAIAQRVSAKIDWNRFLALANRHRVGPLAVQGLAAANVDMPTWFSRQLEDVRRRALFSEMANARELGRLQSCLSDRGIKAIVLKGPAVSLRAFGQLGLRTYRDLDLLVGEERIVEACAVLCGAGYQLVEPLQDGTVDWLDWRMHHKDMVLGHAGTGQLVELHWRLFDNRALMPMSELPAPVPLGLAPLETALVLPVQVELRYHCLHGALHGWSRLRWLADVNATLAAANLALAEGRIEPAVAQALILCRNLLGAVFPPDIDNALANSLRGRALAKLAWSEIVRSGARELEDVRLGSTVKNLSHYGLLDARSIIEELRFDFLAQPRVDAGMAQRRGRVLNWFARHIGSR